MWIIIRVVSAHSPAVKRSCSFSCLCSLGQIKIALFTGGTNVWKCDAEWDWIEYVCVWGGWLFTETDMHLTRINPSLTPYGKKTHLCLFPLPLFFFHLFPFLWTRHHPKGLQLSFIQTIFFPLSSPFSFLGNFLFCISVHFSRHPYLHRATF